MFKSLVIGCSNIGALYDLDNNDILTHTKAFYLNPEFSLTVFDTNNVVANQIAKKYNCQVIDHLDVPEMKDFDCVSICTPTNTHLEYLEKALKAGVKVVICEKPVSYHKYELEKADEIYRKSESFVLVNYLRRFLPAYQELKKVISEINRKEKLTNISIRYQRGFMNNCSHGFDIIEFLLEKEIELSDIKKFNIVHDYFDLDPTLSLQGYWNDINFNVLGLGDVMFSYFEVELFFEYHKIGITQSGQLINVYKAIENKKVFQPLEIQSAFTRENCLKDYMKQVIHHVHGFLLNKENKDNFLTSVALNQRMLEYLNY